MNDEINLTPEQQRTLELKKNERERIEEQNKELIDKRDKIKGEDYQTQKKNLERDIKKIDEQIENAENTNAFINAKLNEFAEEYKNRWKNKEIYKIFFSDGELRLAHWQISGLIKKFYVYFSALDNPFEASLTDNEKKELLASIRGVSVNDISNYDVADNVTTANNAKDSE